MNSLTRYILPRRLNRLAVFRNREIKSSNTVRDPLNRISPIEIGIARNIHSKKLRSGTFSLLVSVKIFLAFTSFATETYIHALVSAPGRKLLVRDPKTPNLRRAEAPEAGSVYRNYRLFILPRPRLPRPCRKFPPYSMIVVFSRAQ